MKPTPLRPLESLVDREHSAWPAIAELLDRASLPARVLPCEKAAGDSALLALQVTTRSALGALAHACAGVIAGGGALRLLGAGSPAMRGVLDWNAGPSCRIRQPLVGAMIVAHDAWGGVFAMDGGLFERHVGTIVYRAPDTLDWEDLAMSYSDLLGWAAVGDHEAFFARLREPSWRDDIDQLTADECWAFEPAAWESGPPLLARPRRAVTVKDFWSHTRPSD